MCGCTGNGNSLPFPVRANILRNPAADIGDPTTQATANTATKRRCMIAFLLLLCLPHARNLIVQQRTTLWAGIAWIAPVLLSSTSHRSRYPAPLGVRRPGQGRRSWSASGPLRTFAMRDEVISALSSRARRAVARLAVDGKKHAAKLYRAACAPDLTEFLDNLSGPLGSTNDFSSV